jgi:hypothetical protein
MSVTGWFPLRRHASGHRVERMAGSGAPWIVMVGFAPVRRGARIGRRDSRGRQPDSGVSPGTPGTARVGQAAPATVCGDCGMETAGFGRT